MFIVKNERKKNKVYVECGDLYKQIEIVAKAYVEKEQFIEEVNEYYAN